MRFRFRIELALVALACFGPLLAAYLLYYYGEPGELPRVENPERTLIEPAAPLPPLPGLDTAGTAVDTLWGGGVWVLFHARTTPCDESCRGNLVRARQVHAALGRDSSRVRFAYLGPDAASLAGEDRILAGAGLDGAPGRKLLGLLESVGTPPGEAGRLYVADPHGNLVLSYPPDAEQEGLLDDLERLLDVSRIG